MSIRIVPAGVIALAVAGAPVTVFAAKPPVAKGNPHLTTPRPSTRAPKPAAPKGATVKATAPKTTHGNPHPTSTTPTGTTTTTTTTLNPIAQKIASKPNLASRLQSMLPSGMTLDQASLGFKNQGQFIAALHVSQNLGIPFADLKTAMTGINPTLPPDAQPTAASTLSLGQAIQTLRPSADVTTATTTAERQASADLGSTTPTTGTKTPKKKSGR